MVRIGSGTVILTRKCISGPMGGKRTGKEAWSWQGLSRPTDGVVGLEQKHGLETVYHGLWTV